MNTWTRSRTRSLTGLVAAARGLATIGVAQASASLIAQISQILLAKNLGPSAFGSFALATTLFSIVAVINDGGIGNYALQKFSGGRFSGDSFADLARNRLFLGLTATLVGFITLLIFASTKPEWTPIAVLLLAQLPYGYLAMKAVRFRILEKFQISSLASGLSTCLIPLGAFLMVSFHSSPAAASVGAVMSLTLSALIWGLLERSDPLKPSARSLLPALRGGRPFLVTAVSVAIYFRGDRLVVGWFEGETQLGYYAAAYSVVFGATLFGTTIQIFSLPWLAKLYRTSPAWLAQVRTKFFLMWVGGLLIALGLTLRSDWIITSLYGDDFANSGPVLLALSVLVPLYVTNPFLGNMLIASDRAEVLAKVSLVNLAAALTMYPLAVGLFGIVGAAVASVAVEAIGQISMLRHLLKRKQSI